MVPPMLAVGRLRRPRRWLSAVLADGPDVGVEILVRTGLASVLSAGARYPEAIEQLEQAAIAAPEQDRLSLDALPFDAPRAGRPDRLCS